MKNTSPTLQEVATTSYNLEILPPIPKTIEQLITTTPEKFS